MDEKTAKIPSLKEFKDSRKEKDAHSTRTSSMQTKKQMERSVSKTKESERKASQRNSRQRDSENRRPTEKKSAPSQKSTHRPYAGSDSQKKQRPPSVQQRTYVRDRLNENAQAEIDRNTEPLKQYRTQSGSSANRTVNKPTVQNKATVKKSKKPVTPKVRKFRNLMVYLSIISIVLIVSIVLSLTVFFKTEQIIVSGNEMYSQQEIIEASGLSLGQNIFTANKSAASDRIEKTYPYIENANVYFSIPDAIKIDITMAHPSYMIEALGGFYIVSDKGKVLEVVATDDEAQVPIIEGVTVEGKTPGEYLEFSSEIVEKGLEEIFSAVRELNFKTITGVNVETTKGGTVKFSLAYDDRIVIELGTPDHLNYKINTAYTIVNEKLDIDGSKPKGVLDVSKSFETKKSYFNEYSILADSVAPTITVTEPTEALESTEPYYEDYYYENYEYSDEYDYSDEYEYTDEDYSYGSYEDAYY